MDERGNPVRPEDNSTYCRGISDLEMSSVTPGSSMMTGQEKDWIRRERITQYRKKLNTYTSTTCTPRCPSRSAGDNTGKGPIATRWGWVLIIVVKLILNTDLGWPRKRSKRTSERT